MSCYLYLYIRPVLIIIVKGTRSPDGLNGSAAGQMLLDDFRDRELLSCVPPEGTYTGRSNEISLKFSHNLDRAKLTAHRAFSFAIREFPCPCRIKSATYLTFPIERRPHQCDLFVVFHVFVFYRVADMRSNPEGDETFFDRLRTGKPKMFGRRDITEIISSCRTRNTCACTTGNMVIPNSNINRQRPGNKERKG